MFHSRRGRRRPRLVEEAGVRRREAPERVERRRARASVRMQPRVGTDPQENVDDAGEEERGVGVASCVAEDRVGLDGCGGGDCFRGDSDSLIVATAVESSRGGVDARREDAREEVRDDEEVPAALQGERGGSQRARRYSLYLPTRVVEMGGEEGDERCVVVVHVRPRGLHDAAEEEDCRLAVRGARGLRGVVERGQELVPRGSVVGGARRQDVGGVDQRAHLDAVLRARQRGERPLPHRRLRVVPEDAPVPCRRGGEEHRGEAVGSVVAAVERVAKRLDAARRIVHDSLDDRLGLRPGDGVPAG